MADDATRVIALERLLQRKEEKHKKELDRLHKRIRQLEAQNRQLQPKSTCPFVTSGTSAKTPLTCVLEDGHEGDHDFR